MDTESKKGSTVKKVRLTTEEIKRNAWEELKFELSNADLREIIELLTLEPKAYDGLNQYIEDNYDRA